MRVAILGMGRWGLAWKRVLDELPGVEVVGDGRPGAGGRRPDYSVVLAAPGVDAAIVALPVALHLAAIRDAVERGICVLCEKPVVSDRDELHDLVALDAGTDVVIRVDQNYRLRGWVAAVRAVLPELGAIRHVTISFAQPEFLDGGRDALAHPLLDDMAIHHMDLLRHLTGSEAVVLGAWEARPEPTSYSGFTDLDAVLRLADGALVSYSGSWAARGATTPWDGDWEIRCDRGTVRVRSLEVTVERPGQEPQERPYAPAAREDADLAAAWSAFTAAVSGDADAGVTVADNARSIGLVFDLKDHAKAARVGGRHSGRDEQK